MTDAEMDAQRPTPPPPSRFGVSPMFLSSLPPLAAGLDQNVRQFYGASGDVPQQRILPATNIAPVAIKGDTGAAGATGPAGAAAKDAWPTRRVVIPVTTGVLANNASATGTIALGRTFTLLEMEVSAPCRIRLYATAAARAADAGRGIADPPTYTEHKIIYDLVLRDLSKFFDSGSAVTTRHTVPANTPPWKNSANPSMTFGSSLRDDSLLPFIAATGLSAGEQLTVRAYTKAEAIVIYGGGLSVAVYCIGLNTFPSGEIDDPNGDPVVVGGSGDGFPGEEWPQFWTGTPLDPGMAHFTIYEGRLLGAWTDGAGVIKGLEFLGKGPNVITCPAGATQLQLGIDDVVPDNNWGQWTIDITAAPRGNRKWVCSPEAPGSDMSDSPAGDIAYSIENLSGADAAITALFTVVTPQENSR